ncbi:MAG: four helix bundle protein [Acidobacteria bacterium]|nr:four helix bundle protein [Acidobacteriota bacterium]
MRGFRNLKVWRKAHMLTLAVYKMTRMFPREELFGLTTQMRRASSSVGANIAEGCGRAGGADLGRFLQMAVGSASELEYHLLLAHDLGLLNEAGYVRLTGEVTEVKRMLTSLIQKVGADH